MNPGATKSVVKAISKADIAVAASPYSVVQSVSLDYMKFIDYGRVQRRLPCQTSLRQTDAKRSLPHLHVVMLESRAAVYLLLKSLVNIFGRRAS
jgi:hypothetical protein